MNVITVARALNQKAAQQKWHHFCDPGLAFSDPIYQRFLSLWQIKAGVRAMPARSDMTFRDLKDFVRDIVIFERTSIDPSKYSWRLIGTKVTEIAGNNTGKTFDETIPPEHLPRWIECGDLIIDGGRPLRFLGRVHINGREYLNAENLFVPLANDKDQAAFAMGFCRYTPRRTDNEETWESLIAAVPGGFL
jgi:hypothetical protein